jgi:glycosyltransferase involved in cell wall biosynthesis
VEPPQHRFPAALPLVTRRVLARSLVGYAGNDGSSSMKPIRVLYSFPHGIGAGRICYTAWEQVRGASAAGAQLIVAPASVRRELPPAVRVAPTLARGRFRVPFRLLGQLRAIALHDRIVARRLPKLARHVDIVHAWPLGALETLEAAKRLGIPTVLERPNAHTRFAFEVVRAECERIVGPLPPGHEHAYNDAVLRKEEKEYALADALLCPSEFVVKTFIERGFERNRLVRHIYGYDEHRFSPPHERRGEKAGLTALFVGVAAVRKGLHFALEAWLRSPASRDGTFLIAGEVLPAYAVRLTAELAHPSVRLLGHREDIPSLMRQSDLLVLPSIAEGFGLVCAEAMGSGCVPVVSDACTDVCRHLENSLVHAVGDVAELERHMTLLDNDRDLLSRLRAGCLETAPQVTWRSAGTVLLGAYADVLAAARRRVDADAPPLPV